MRTTPSFSGEGQTTQPRPSSGINARRMVHHDAINLKLHALRHIGRARLKRRVEEDAAIAIAHALKAQRKLEIFVIFFGLQIAVVFGQAFAMNEAVFHGPAFMAHFRPAVESLPIEEGDPIFARQRSFLFLGSEQTTNGQRRRQILHESRHEL